MALTPYTLTGRVVDETTRELLAGVKVQILNARTKTDERGVYSLTVELDEQTRPKVLFTKKDYIAQSVTPFRRSGRVKTNLKQVRLERVESSLDQELPRALLAPEEAYNELKELFPDDPKQALVRGILKQVMALYGLLIPAIIALLAKFGITTLSNLVGKSCPNNSTLRIIIAKKNGLVRQLNNAYRVTDRVAKTVAGITTLITAVKAAIKIILKLPIPQSVPPGIGIPVGITTTFSNTVTKIEKKLDNYQALSAAILGALILLRAALGQALKYLSILDALIVDCTAEANGTVNLLPRPPYWGSIGTDFTGAGGLGGTGAGGSDTGLDTDGDGFTDFTENAAGTNPGDPNSFPGGVQYNQGDQVIYEVQNTLSTYICNTDHTATTTGVTGPPGIGDYWDQVSVLEQDGVSVPNGLFLDGDQFKDAEGRTVGDTTVGIVTGGTDVDTITLPGEEPITQEQLSAELQILRAQTTRDGQPVQTEVNGFIMDVQNDEKNPVGSLKRRYAVAKNKDGVILLKGEPSLSSSDQILIDELVFYIQQNDLKSI